MGIGSKERVGEEGVLSGVVASVSWTCVIAPPGALAMEALATASSGCVPAARAGEGTYAKASMVDAYKHKCADQNQIRRLLRSSPPWPKVKTTPQSRPKVKAPMREHQWWMHVTIRVPSNTEIKRLLLTSAVAADGRTTRNSCVCITRSMFCVSDCWASKI